MATPPPGPDPAIKPPWRRRRPESRLNVAIIGSIVVHVILLVFLQFVKPALDRRAEEEEILAKKEPQEKVKFEPIKKEEPEKKPEPKPEEKKPPPMRAPRPAEQSRPSPTPGTTHVDLTVGLDPNSFGGDGIVVPSGETLIGDPQANVAPPPPPMPPPPPPSPPPVVTVKTRPRALNVPRMPYPEAARRRGVQGEIQVMVTVSATGEVTRVELKQGVDPQLDELALEALRKARFSPAVGSDGNPMTHTLLYRYVFRLEDE